MRALFLLLVAANLGLFAWTRYYAAPDSASDPEPARRQVKPDGIRLLAVPKWRHACSNPNCDGNRANQHGGAARMGGFFDRGKPRARKSAEPIKLARVFARRSEKGRRVGIHPAAGNRPAALKKTRGAEGLGVDATASAAKAACAGRFAGLFSNEAPPNSRMSPCAPRRAQRPTGERDNAGHEICSRCAERIPRSRQSCKVLPRTAGTEIRNCQ